jgi:hypothetical protein
MEHLRLTYQNGDYLSLEDTLKLGLMFKSTLPVDKVYCLLVIVVDRNVPSIHANHTRTNDSQFETNHTTEAFEDTLKVLEESNELFGRALGRETGQTRRGYRLLRTTSIGLKNALRNASDLHRVIERLQQGNKDPSGKDSTRITLDYTETNTAEAVYTVVARNLIKENNPFSFLHHAGIGQPRNLKDLPSWVPDWSANLEIYSLPQPRPKRSYPIDYYHIGYRKPDKEDVVDEGK